MNYKNINTTCIFAYNFPHKKTQEGLYKLIFNKINIDYVILMDPIKLNFTPSKIRSTVKGLIYENPKDICERFSIPCCILNHNSVECKNFLQFHKFDVGIILGSRIIKKYIIDQFKIGIINMHPGLLPQNRGLDNIKWAILKNYKQGVTTHIINDQIDRGFLIDKQTIDVYEDDSLVDIFMRLQNKEQTMMIEALLKLQNNFIPATEIDVGNYYKSMKDEEENEMLKNFDSYKKQYNQL